MLRKPVSRLVFKDRHSGLGLCKHRANEAFVSSRNTGRTISKLLFSSLRAVPQPGIHNIQETFCCFGYIEIEKRFSSFATVVGI